MVVETEIVTAGTTLCHDGYPMSQPQGLCKGPEQRNLFGFCNGAHELAGATEGVVDTNVALSRESGGEVWRSELGHKNTVVLARNKGIRRREM